MGALWDVDWMRVGLGEVDSGPQAETVLCPLQVPVAHCFGPRGLYKRKFCAVCRKGLDAPALRCEGTADPGSWAALLRVAQPALYNQAAGVEWWPEGRGGNVLGSGAAGAGPQALRAYR